jgi:hypothetical protein
MACDDEIIPLQERIATVGDDADLQEIYDTERLLLYGACVLCQQRQRAEAAGSGRCGAVVKSRLSFCSWAKRTNSHWSAKVRR